jgi:hypothetical protein
MNTNYFFKGKTWLFFFLFFFSGVTVSLAEIELIGETLTVTGFIRHQTVFNMGEKNPYNSNPQYDTNGYLASPPKKTGYGVQQDKNWCNLNRTWFVTEWNYRPADIFKLYSKIRVIEDSTTNVDGDLYEYNALALSTDHYGSTGRLGHDNHVTAEIWEMYGDLDLGNLWLRLGKQQIVWGEMISARILDVVNPLDKSWHFTWEPEEFENIRIPQWMLRAVYNIEPGSLPLLDELYVEGFLNPGDIVPTNDPQIGNPYRHNYQYEYNPNNPDEWGGIWRTTEENDRRGDREFGFRLGYKLGQFAGTLNYAHLFSDDAISKTTRLYGTIPAPWARYLGDAEKDYPRIDIYGMSMNYAFDQPVNTVMTIEATYIPNAPWYTIDGFYFPAGVPPVSLLPVVGMDYIDTREFNYAINLQRFSNIIPGQQFMNVTFQYQGKYVPEADDVKWTPGAPPPSYQNPRGDYGTNTGNIVEKINTDAFVLSLSQDFAYKTYKASCLIIWQPDGVYRINPGFAYTPGDHWRFDVFANWWGGNAYDNNNKSCLNYFYYQDEVMARITYQF